MARPSLVAALLLPAAAACGPYSEVGQKLDVATPIADGETFVAASGSEVRLLLLGSGGPGAPFVFTSFDLPYSAGRSVWSAAGTFAEDPAAGALTLTELHQYTLPDERSVGLFSRRGAWRQEVHLDVPLREGRAPGRLAVAGDARFEGSYVALTPALAGLGAATARDAACAFQLANLAVLSSQVRIIGFGGPGMTQYSAATDYQGIVSGSLRVQVDGLFSSTTTITYRGFSDFGGVAIDGAQVIFADSSGDGHMEGAVAFALQPAAPAGAAPPPPLQGEVRYGVAGGGGDSIRISGGSASGGLYDVSLQGGGVATVDPVSPPAPSVGACLGLP